MSVFCIITFTWNKSSSEAVVHRCFLQLLQYSQENTCLYKRHGSYKSLLFFLLISLKTLLLNLQNSFNSGIFLLNFSEKDECFVLNSGLFCLFSINFLSTTMKISQYLWISHWPKIVSHSNVKIKIWPYKVRMFCLAPCFFL